MSDEEDRKTIERRQTERLLLLRVAYREVGDGPYANFFIWPETLVPQTGLNLDTIHAAVHYLSGKNLLTIRGTGYLFSLTHEGYREAENSFDPSGTATKNFSSTVIHNTFNAPVGAMQAGDHNTANVVQNNDTGSRDELRRMLRELQDQVQQLAQPGARDEAEGIVVDWVEAAEGSSNPAPTALARKEARLTSLLTRENLTTAVKLVPDIVKLLQQLL